MGSGGVGSYPTAEKIVDWEINGIEVVRIKTRTGGYCIMKSRIKDCLYPECFILLFLLKVM